MSLPLGTEAAKNYFAFPLAYHAMVSLTDDFMNPKAEDNGNVFKNMDYLESFGRRVVGLLAYPALCVAALAEAAVRLAFSLLAALPLIVIVCCREDTGNLTLKYVSIAGGTIATVFDMPLRMASALYHKVIMDTRQVIGSIRIDNNPPTNLTRPVKFEELFLFGSCCCCSL